MLLGALAAWVFQHLRLAFQSMFAAKSLDPPLRERRRPHHHYPTTPPPTPAASAQSAGDGPTALITAVSKPDSVIFINPSTRDLHAKVPELTFSPNVVPPSWRRWRPCLRHTTNQPTIVAFEESADSGPTAQGATVSKTDSVVGENVFAEIQERETASSKPKDSAQSVNNKKRPTLEPLFT